MKLYSQNRATVPSSAFFRRSIWFAESSFVRRQQSVEGERVAFGLGESGALVEPRIVEQVVTGQPGPDCRRGVPSGSRIRIFRARCLIHGNQAYFAGKNPKGKPAGAIHKPPVKASYSFLFSPPISLMSELCRHHSHSPCPQRARRETRRPIRRPFDSVQAPSSDGAEYQLRPPAGRNRSSGL